MICVNCGKESRMLCLCGYCPECNEKYEHFELHQMMRLKQAEKMKQEEKEK